MDAHNVGTHKQKRLVNRKADWGERNWRFYKWTDNIQYTEWHSYRGGACLLDSVRALPRIKADLWLHNHNCWRAAAPLHDSTEFAGCQLHLLLCSRGTLLLRKQLFNKWQRANPGTKGKKINKERNYNNFVPCFIYCNTSRLSCGSPGYKNQSKREWRK